MELAEARLDNGQTIRYLPDKKLGEGIEKEFFETEDETLVIGFYKEQAGVHDPDRVERLTDIIGKYNPTRDPETAAFWKAHFCWPIAVVLEPHVGILCPKFPPQYYFSDAKGEKKGRWFSKHRLLMKRLEDAERGTWLERIQICRQLARAVGKMHIAGLAHSDLSGNNILMDPSTGASMLIDIDSLVIRYKTPCKVLGTKGYIAPEVVATSHLPLKNPEKNLPNIKTDLHALAVIIYEMLMLRHPLEGKKIHSDDPETDMLLAFGENALFIEHPEDASNRVEGLDVSYHALGHHLVPLVARAFVDGLHDPEERPTAYDWEKALTYTTDILYPCQGECWQKWFVCQTGAAPECPFCGWKPSEAIPMMHLFQRYKRGQYLSENHYLTIWDKKKLHPWHVRSDIPYPADLSGDAGCEGAFILKDGTWMFRNESAGNMICSAWERVAPGNTVTISDDKLLLLNKRKLAVFKF